MNKEWVMILDTDGVLTDGTFYNNAEGKFLKRFGPDDWDALWQIVPHADIHIISGDKTGFSIVEKRVQKVGFPITLVSGKIPDRWNWIKETYPDQKIIYIGDGIFDWYCLEKADYGIAPNDALYHTKARADYIVGRKGAHRFVAEACMHVLAKFFNVNVARIGEPDDLLENDFINQEE